MDKLIADEHEFMQEDDSIDLNALDVNGFLDAQGSQDSIHFNQKLGDDEYE